MQVPIIRGVYADTSGNIRAALPVNYEPVVVQSGVSDGYMRPADGIVEFTTGPGADRLGINWNGRVFRAMGTKLVEVDRVGRVTEIGDIGGQTMASFDYGFDRMSVVSDGRFFYYDGESLTEVTDEDLLSVVDHIWIDGYYLLTDGQYLIVTDLNDPTQINALKYGSAEIDPDGIVGVEKLRNEAWAIGRYTSEVFDNVGGSLFPFARIDGAHVPIGAVGTHAKCVFMEAIAVLGGGKNEPVCVHMMASGQSRKISNDEVDWVLSQYTESELASSILESRSHNGRHALYVHLPDRTLVFDAEASKQMEQPVWSILTSSMQGYSKYKARGFVLAFNKWICGSDDGKIGYLDESVGTHYGEHVRTELTTLMLYNGSRSAIVHEMELVALTGRMALADDARISSSYSVDGVTWSQPRTIAVGRQGNRSKRLCWLANGMLRNWRIQRFSGDSRSHISVMRLEVRIEGLS